MSYIIPDPRWEMPWLLTPHDKGTGQVTIDSSNSLTENILEFYIFNNGVAHELVSNKTYAYVGAMNTGRADLSQAGDHMLLGTPQSLPEMTLLLRSKSLTVPANTYPTAYEAKTSLAQYSFYQNGGIGAGMMRIGGFSAPGTMNVDFFDGDYHTLAQTHKTNGTAYLYLDGKQELSVSYSSSTAPTWTNLDIGTDSPAYPAHMLLDYIIVCNKQLSIEKIREIEKNPNALLLPA